MSSLKPSRTFDDSSSPEISYNPSHFKKLFEVEDKHFWFKSRNKIIAILLEQVVQGFAPGYKVLEVGCGDGNTLRVLEQTCRGGEVTGLEPFAEAIQLARSRVSCNLIQGDIHSHSFSDPFQLICIFDVLEHLPDDKNILRILHGLLVPRGSLFITVPAYPSLWSGRDIQARHQRRYCPEDLHTRLEEAGFRVDYLTPFMTCLFPVLFLARKMRRASGEAGLSAELRIIPVVNSLLGFLCAQETKWIRKRRKLPWGTSLLALATKI